MTIDHLKDAAAAVAGDMKSGEVTPQLHERFIDVRSALFQRGIFDPVLVRFDSATAPPATRTRSPRNSKPSLSRSVKCGWGLTPTTLNRGASSPPRGRLPAAGTKRELLTPAR
jgi:hypothetical protein